MLHVHQLIAYFVCLLSACRGESVNSEPGNAETLCTAEGNRREDPVHTTCSHFQQLDHKAYLTIW